MAPALPEIGHPSSVNFKLWLSEASVLCVGVSFLCSDRTGCTLDLGSGGSIG